MLFLKSLANNLRRPKSNLVFENKHPSPENSFTSISNVNFRLFQLTKQIKNFRQLKLTKSMHSLFY